MDTKKLRQEMVETQLKTRGISDKKVLNAFLEVPREEFVPSEYKSAAYFDEALPIGDGQTISQPYMVAIMTELLKLHKDAKVLEVGTGSGYQAAILSKLCKKVISMERIPSLAKKSQEKLNKLGYQNIEVVSGDGTLGYEKETPYEGIIITAAAPKIPPPLVSQLKLDGKLVVPVGDRWSQILKIVTKTKTQIEVEDSISCVFVPLIGKFGFAPPSSL